MLTAAWLNFAKLEFGLLAELFPIVPSATVMSVLRCWESKSQIRSSVAAIYENCLRLASDMDVGLSMS